MANEFNISLNLSCNNGYTNNYQKSGQYSQTAQGLVGGAQTIATTPGTLLTTTSLATLGYGYFQNLDATNSVDIGKDNAGALDGFVRLKPGEFSYFRLMPGVTLRAQANVAACKLYWVVYND